MADDKAKIKNAQQQHLSSLFGDDAPVAAEGHRAADHQADRARSLDSAAKAKTAKLSADEAERLAVLKARNEQAKKRVRPTASAAPKPSATPAAAQRRTDLGAAALRNMQQHLRQPPPQSSPAPTPPAPSASTPPPAPPPTPARRPGAAPAGQAPRTRRPAPSPEELDKLLRQLAASAPPRRPGAAPGGPEAVEAAPAVETPPDVPDEAPERNQEKQAEIIDKLRAREASLTKDAHQPIPQADQERAVEEAVNVTLPVQTKGNAVSAAPLHNAIAALQVAMRAHDANDQVSGANTVQRRMPHHPLYDEQEHS